MDSFKSVIHLLMYGYNTDHIQDNGFLKKSLKKTEL